MEDFGMALLIIFVGIPAMIFGIFMDYLKYERYHQYRKNQEEEQDNRKRYYERYNKYKKNTGPEIVKRRERPYDENQEVKVVTSKEEVIVRNEEKEETVESNNTWTCYYCGVENDSRDEFCKNCGSRKLTD